MTECRYDRPLTLDAALGTLAASGGEASIMAGGVALGILMNEKLAQPTHLLDISRVRELRGIESRPDRSQQWSYIFFVDLEGHNEDANIQAAFTEMRSLTAGFRILGSYPVEVATDD